ncbi:MULTISPECIES: GH25 family lysozyme [Bacillus cereus group]|uniref:GH25 family lysozyme n=1 Tax=Bacillus cereus group TaxID=86661 RepID=UPI001AEE08E6|nr:MULTISPECIES: GH25 family lysozyme [Bacillus cereus group]QTR79142.1 N-acetylmuramoyl-L-alanine amidase [Bacillus cytotoxicus]
MGHIVDISKWNGNINWDVAAPQLDLAICRVQYGSKKIDERYKSYVDNLERQGIPHAAYAYGCYISVNDAIVEADDFMKRVSPNAKFLVLDVEDDTLKSCGATNLAKASQAFIDRCKSKGWKVGLYVSHHMYNNYGLSGVKADFLWIPRYGGNKPAYECDIWQYTETGHVPGIGKCDLNKLIGNKPLAWFTNQTVEKQEGGFIVADNKLVATGGIGFNHLQEVAEFLNKLGYGASIVISGKNDGIFSIRTERRIGSELDKFTAWLDVKNWWYQYE